MSQASCLVRWQVLIYELTKIVLQLSQNSLLRCVINVSVGVGMVVSCWALPQTTPCRCGTYLQEKWRKHSDFPPLYWKYSSIQNPGMFSTVVHVLHVQQFKNAKAKHLQIIFYTLVIYVNNQTNLHFLRFSAISEQIRMFKFQISMPFWMINIVSIPWQCYQGSWSSTLEAQHIM